MSGDVQEVDNSIMSSIDMLFKNPVLIIIYFTTLLVISLAVDTLHAHFRTYLRMVYGLCW